MLEVQRQALLAAVAPHEVRAQAVDAGVVGAGEITHTRPLDLDDARALVGELARAEGRRHRVLERDDGDARERQSHQKLLGSPSTCSAT
jgi:hypothetical protein